MLIENIITKLKNSGYPSIELFTYTTNKCVIKYNYKIYGRPKIYKDAIIEIEGKSSTDLQNKIISFITNTSLDYIII